MRERIIKFIESSGITSAKFADDIGVQRSSVSHILSGRNNPSFDFIQKILIKYKHLQAEWLLLGTGEMYKVARQAVLFDNADFELNKTKPELNSNQIIEPDSVKVNEDLTESAVNKEETSNLFTKIQETKTIEKVIVFYNDKTFSMYTPET